MTRKEADQIVCELLRGYETLERLIEDYPEVQSVNRAHDRMVDVVQDVEMFLHGLIYEDEKQ